MILLLLPSLMLLPLFTTPASAQSGIIFQKTWGGSKDEIGYGVAVDSSGNSYVTGYTQSFGPGSPTYPALILLKYNPTGSLLWQRVWSANGNSGSWDHGNGVAVDGSGNIYVTGDTSNWSTGTSDLLLLKFDSSGSLVWQETWGGNMYEDGRGIAVDSAGNALVTGLVYEASPHNLGSSGNNTLATPNFFLVEANFTFRTPTLALDTPTGAVQTPSGSQSFGGSVDEFLVKFTSAGPTVGQGDVFGLPSLEFYSLAGGAVILVGALTTILLRRRTYRLAAAIGILSYPEKGEIGLLTFSSI